jgi:hypothetical protein
MAPRVGRRHAASIRRRQSLNWRLRLNWLKRSKAVRARRGYSGMIRVCCAAGISTVLLEDLDSTNRFAVMKSAIENAATNDAHAN